MVGWQRPTQTRNQPDSSLIPNSASIFFDGAGGRNLAVSLQDKLQASLDGRGRSQGRGGTAEQSELATLDASEKATGLVINPELGLDLLEEVDGVGGRNLVS